jgi:segregation and condensation protein B
MSNDSIADTNSEPNDDPEALPEEVREVEATEEAEQTSSLPDAVPEGTLSGDVPQGEAPRLSLVIEAILFASQKAVTPKELIAHLKSAATAEPNSVAAAFARIRESDVREALDGLQAEVAASGRAYQVRETATGWLLSSAAGFAPWLRALYPEAKPTRLSAPALETLAIIAYRQPIARADMEAVRGVAVDGVMQTLLDRGLVKIAGRAEVAGRPLLYATTQYFLDHFGLRHLDELPNASELRHVPLPKGLPEPAPKTIADEGTPELPGVAEEATEEVGNASAPEPLPSEPIVEQPEADQPDASPLA